MLTTQNAKRAWCAQTMKGQDFVLVKSKNPGKECIEQSMSASCDSAYVVVVVVVVEDVSSHESWYPALTSHRRVLCEVDNDPAFI